MPITAAAVVVVVAPVIMNGNNQVVGLLMGRIRIKGIRTQVRITIWRITPTLNNRIHKNPKTSNSSPNQHNSNSKNHHNINNRSRHINNIKNHHNSRYIKNHHNSRNIKNLCSRNPNHRNPNQDSEAHVLQ